MLKKDLDRSINAGLLAGQSSKQVMLDLEERCDVAKYRAETLVRTEMNYFENQTELKSYEDLGITYYIYLAVRDNRTSVICSVLDGHRYSIKEAQLGINYPPLHPNCRAGTLPDLELENDYRIYKNPITGNHEKTTESYEDWLRNIENKSEKKYNFHRDRIISDFDSINF